MNTTTSYYDDATKTGFDKFAIPYYNLENKTMPHARRQAALKKITPQPLQLKISATTAYNPTIIKDTENVLLSKSIAEYYDKTVAFIISAGVLLSLVVFLYWVH